MTKWVGGHIGGSPEFAKLVMQNKCEGYCLPQGVIVSLYREIAAKRPGVLTKIGMQTFIDPRVEGGKLNSISNQDYVKVVVFEEDEYLFYKTFPINVALIRGSVADENGNLTEDREGVLLEALTELEPATPIAGSNSYRPKGLAIHNVREYTNLAALLPKIYAEQRQSA